MIALGFACAALAASGFFHLLVLGGIGPLAEDANDLTVLALLVSVPVVAALIAYSAFLPAGLFFLVSEIAGWRGWPTHALGGGLAAAAAVYIGDGGFRGPGTPGGQLVMVLVACGMVGGLAYWAVAGRSAGVWLHGAGEATAPRRSGS